MRTRPRLAPFSEGREGDETHPSPPWCEDEPHCASLWPSNESFSRDAWIPGVAVREPDLAGPDDGEDPRWRRTVTCDSLLAAAREASVTDGGVRSSRNADTYEHCVECGSCACTCKRRHRTRRNGFLSIRCRRNGVLNLRLRRNGVLAAEPDVVKGGLTPRAHGNVSPRSALASPYAPESGYDEFWRRTLSDVGEGNFGAEAAEAAARSSQAGAAAPSSRQRRTSAWRSESDRSFAEEQPWHDVTVTEQRYGRGQQGRSSSLSEAARTMSIAEERSRGSLSGADPEAELRSTQGGESRQQGQLAAGLGDDSVAGLSPRPHDDPRSPVRSGLPPIGDAAAGQSAGGAISNGGGGGGAGVPRTVGGAPLAPPCRSVAVGTAALAKPSRLSRDSDGIRASLDTLRSQAGADVGREHPEEEAGTSEVSLVRSAPPQQQQQQQYTLVSTASTPQPELPAVLPLARKSRSLAALAIPTGPSLGQLPSLSPQQYPRHPPTSPGMQHPRYLAHPGSGDGGLRALAPPGPSSAAAVRRSSTSALPALPSSLPGLGPDTWLEQGTSPPRARGVLSHARSSMPHLPVGSWSPAPSGALALAAAPRPPARAWVGNLSTPARYAPQWSTADSTLSDVQDGPEGDEEDGAERGMGPGPRGALEAWGSAPGAIASSSSGGVAGWEGSTRVRSPGADAQSAALPCVSPRGLALGAPQLQASPSLPMALAEPLAGVATALPPQAPFGGHSAPSTRRALLVPLAPEPEPASRTEPVGGMRGGPLATPREAAPAAEGSSHGGGVFFHGGRKILATALSFLPGASNRVVPTAPPSMPPADAAAAWSGRRWLQLPRQDSTPAQAAPGGPAARPPLPQMQPPASQVAGGLAAPVEGEPSSLPLMGVTVGGERASWQRAGGSVSGPAGLPSAGSQLAGQLESISSVGLPRIGGTRPPHPPASAAGR